MDTTRWGDGFSGPQTPVPPVTPPETPAEPGQQDPDYPFEEPETAPELRQQRSESLYSRSTPFWDRVVDLPADGEEYPRDPEYWNHPEQFGDDLIMSVENLRPMQRFRRFLGSSTARYVAGGLLVLVLIAFLCHSIFATVRTITVTGATTFTDEYIIGLSGLEVGMSNLGIDEELVAERIGRERYLRCTLVDVAYDKVTIHVRERVPVATIVQNGRRIIMDDRGWVLEISDDMHTQPAGLISVTGLDVHNAILGQAMTLRMPARLTTYTQILIELRALGGLELITELDMTTMDSITLKTTDGLTIHLGNEGSIHEKIRAMLVVRDNLIRNSYYGEMPRGTIVVSDPASPAYRPPDR